MCVSMCQVAIFLDNLKKLNTFTVTYNNKNDKGRLHLLCYTVQNCWISRLCDMYVYNWITNIITLVQPYLRCLKIPIQLNQTQIQDSSSLCHLDQYLEEVTVQAECNLKPNTKTRPCSINNSLLILYKFISY